MRICTNIMNPSIGTTARAIVAITPTLSKACAQLSGHTRCTLGVLTCSSRRDDAGGRESILLGNAVVLSEARGRGNRRGTKGGPEKYARREVKGQEFGLSTYKEHHTHGTHNVIA